MKNLENQYSKSSKNQDDESKKRPLLILLLCFFMLFAGLMAGIFVSNHFNSGDNNREYIQIGNDQVPKANNSVSDPDSEEIIDNIAIPCWDSISMVANQTEQDVDFYNPEKNENCDFLLTLLLDDGTRLWKSQFIPNGKAVYNITLNQALDAGTYKAKMKYECFTSSGKQLNSSILKFDLVMEE